EGVCAGGSQRGGGEGGDDDASDEALDLRESGSGDAGDAGGSEHRHRFAAEDSGVGGRRRPGVAFVEQRGVSWAAARGSGGVAEGAGGGGRVGGEGCRVNKKTATGETVWFEEW